MGKRLRDPVHGLIVFDDNKPVDMLAWDLIDTAEFQRLRRIRQLGVSEFTFPSAVHSRFAHSIGVFHTARILVEVVRREMKRGGRSVDEEKVDTAIIAALLHDLGHGPFSHAFEAVQESMSVSKRHEEWTADIIRNPSGKIFPLLSSRWAERPHFPEAVASLLEKEDPDDIYHAIVSSSFDADRLDYLRRDKFMTGTGAGAIDFDWLIENVRVAEIEVDAPEESDVDSRRVATFCLDAKALPAAEQFLLARYTLHQQVYFHKATRCVEHMIKALFHAIARLACSRRVGDKKKTGLPENHPIVRFFSSGGQNVENYLALDDAVIFGSLDLMRNAEDANVSDLARRLIERDIFKTLDMAEFGEDQGTQRAKLRRIKTRFSDEIGSGRIIVDDKASIGIYSQIGGDEEKMHKRLHILDGASPKEISTLSRLIQALEPKRAFTRLYFDDAGNRDIARQ